MHTFVEGRKNLKNNTPEPAVLGALGRQQLMVQYPKKLKDTRYSKRYYLLLHLNNIGSYKGSWATEVKSILYGYGFRYVLLY